MNKKFILGLSTLAVVTVLIPSLSFAKDGVKPPKLTNTTAVDAKGDSHGISEFKKRNDDKKKKTVTGKVTAISPTSITVEVSRKAESEEHTLTNATVVPGQLTKSFTFIIDANTHYLRRFKGTATVNEIAIGDLVKVWGTAKTGGTALTIWNMSIWYVEQHGVVSNLNTTTGMFTFTVTKDKVEYNTTVKYDDMTKFLMKDGTVKTSADLMNGQSIKVQGAWDSIGKFILAKRIVIKS